MRRIGQLVALVAAVLVASTGLAGANVAGFSDVKGHEFYAAPVAWMQGAGLTTGVGDTGQYQPDGEIDRAQIATFLWRLEGRPGGYPHHGFEDVPPGSYFDNAVRWLKAEGLTTGVGGTNRYEPFRGLTRAELAALLWRFEGRPGGNPPHGFVDVPAGVYFDEAVKWLKAEGLTTGVGGSNRYEPHLPLTRGELAAFIWRYSDRPAPPNPGDTKSCGDFANRQDAQSWYGLYFPYYGDVANLDANNNGVACDHHSYEPPPPPPPDGGTVHPGAYCSPAGATGTSATGVPMTCATHSCDGTAYDPPRWRRTTC